MHGGGPQISKMLSTLKIDSEFVDGNRVTDSETMAVGRWCLVVKLTKKLYLSSIGMAESNWSYRQGWKSCWQKRCLQTCLEKEQMNLDLDKSER